MWMRSSSSVKPASSSGLELDHAADGVVRPTPGPAGGDLLPRYASKAPSTSGMGAPSVRGDPSDGSLNKRGDPLVHERGIAGGRPSTAAMASAGRGTARAATASPPPLRDEVGDQLVGHGPDVGHHGVDGGGLHGDEVQATDRGVPRWVELDDRPPVLGGEVVHHHRREEPDVPERLVAPVDLACVVVPRDQRDGRELGSLPRATRGSGGGARRARHRDRGSATGSAGWKAVVSEVSVIGSPVRIRTAGRRGRAPGSRRSRRWLPGRTPARSQSA